MNLQTFTYYNKGKKTKISVEVCDTVWKKTRGLMFRKNSSPLLFIFDKNQDITIHSFFCKPFKALWLDDKKRVVKIIDVKNWAPYFSEYGRYLLEIPISSTK
ncbi:putative ACR [uncultured archaeon]|nr:putative ACR [uncultured archaeon]